MAQARAKRKTVKYFVNCCTMKECHDTGYLTTVISEDVVQRVLKMTCTTTFVIMCICETVRGKSKCTQRGHFVANDPIRRRVSRTSSWHRQVHQFTIHYFRYEVLTAVAMTSTVVLDVTPFNMVELYQRSSETSINFHQITFQKTVLFTTH
jgi:hypothetical protein